MRLMDETKIIKYEGGLIYAHSSLSPLVKIGVNRFERAKVLFIKDHIRPGDMFIDVGASEGFYTFLASRFVGDNGLVVAIEPEDRNYSRLLMGIEGNDSANIITRKEAAYHKEMNRISLNLGFQTGTHTLLYEARATMAGTQTVSTTTLDKIMEQIEGPGDEDHPRRIGLKIDVEGVEDRVFKGANKLLADRRLQYVAIDCHPSLNQWATVENVVKALNSYGLKPTYQHHVNQKPNEVFVTRVDYRTDL